jgi:hypothetical protein
MPQSLLDYKKLGQMGLSYLTPGKKLPLRITLKKSNP